ncbi:MAG: YciI family protein [Acidimicrobiales bacterium]
MQYILILAADPDAWADNDTDTDTDDGVMDDWALYTRALAEAGVLVAGHALHGNDAATTVRVRSGERLVTDGPFTETREHLIGYYIIDTPDLDTALAWAARVPNVRIGSVEVRPLVPGTSTEAMLGGG